MSAFLPRFIPLEIFNPMLVWLSSLTPRFTTLSNIHREFALGSELEAMLNTLGASLEHSRMFSSGHWYQGLAGKQFSRIYTANVW